MSSAYFTKHRPLLDQTLEAIRLRDAFSPFQESPSRRFHPEGAHEEGKARFASFLNADFPLVLPGSKGRVGAEVSPYTAAPLGIRYPRLTDFDAVFDAMTLAMGPWALASVEDRVGLLLEILHTLSLDTFANAYATMHTAGQPFMTAFAGSGANSLDRGLEALAYAYKAMKDVPMEATFTRDFRGQSVTLKKHYRLVPRGVALVIACGSYPAWNAYPAICANLAAGNPVMVKPHPQSVLPMAMAVLTARKLLADGGFDPNLVMLVADEPTALITRELATRPEVAIIDFTGSQSFGDWLVDNCRHADVYTETSGCNAVIVDSTRDLDGLMDALAEGLALFSAQMCTAPQNFFLPSGGVRTDQGLVSPGEFSQRLAHALDRLTQDGDMAAAICGAAMNEGLRKTLDRLVSTLGEDAILRRHTSYDHPDFPHARTITPLLIRADARSEIYRKEHFGPVGFIIEVDDSATGLARACEDAKRVGTIANYVYSVCPDFLERAQAEFAQAGASVGLNLIRQRPINYTAAFSDYHVTGLNPAGNACLTDLAFVTNRFRIVQSRRELSR